MNQSVILRTRVNRNIGQRMYGSTHRLHCSDRQLSTADIECKHKAETHRLITHRPLGPIVRCDHWLKDRDQGLDRIERHSIAITSSQTLTNHWLTNNCGQMLYSVRLCYTLSDCRDCRTASRVGLAVGLSASLCRAIPVWVEDCAQGCPHVRHSCAMHGLSTWLHCAVQPAHSPTRHLTHAVHCRLTQIRRRDSADWTPSPALASQPLAIGPSLSLCSVGEQHSSKLWAQGRASCETSSQFCGVTSHDVSHDLEWRNATHTVCECRTAIAGRPSATITLVNTQEMTSIRPKRSKGLVDCNSA